MKQVTDKYCIRKIGTPNFLLTCYSAIGEDGQNVFSLSNLDMFPIWAVDTKEKASYALKNDIPLELSTYERPAHAEEMNPNEYEIVRQRVTIEIDKVIV